VFSAVKVFTGTRPGPPLETLVARVAPTPLFLISADWDIEREANNRYAQAATEELPAGIGHAHGLRDLGRQYERRVVSFFDRTLLTDG
jgi:hypothetical protein